MAKKKITKALAKTDHLPDLIAESVHNQSVKNGFAEAIGFNSTGLPQISGFFGTEQISSPDTIFKNLRWLLVSNLRQVLSQAYVEIGLIQTIIDVPVDDALRGGIEIKSKQLDESQIEELQISLDRDDDLTKVGQAGKWTHLYGGGAVIVLTDQDPEMPLDLDSIGPDTPVEFRAVDLWELFWDKQNTEGYDPEMQSEEFECYNYYGEKLHKSRVMRMKGIEPPSFIRPRLRGWGLSRVEILVRSINQYLKATDLGFEVLDEFKLDVYKIKNLVNTLLSPNGNQKIQQRVQMANWQKNYQNAIVMDSEDDFDHKQLSFAGLAEAMAGIRMQVAADMRMPMTKLFGISAAGFNSGEDDIEVYNSMVESQVRNKIKYAILRLLEIKCQKLFGFVPDDLSATFKPLRVLSSEQEENVKTQKYARVSDAKSKGEMTQLEYRDACNKGGLFDITLDTSESSLNPDDHQIEDLISTEYTKPGEAKDADEPGANRFDTQKPKAPGSKTEAKDAKPAKEAKEVKNDQPIIMPEPFSLIERMERILTNSAAFDKASYEADGGDDWIDSRRREFFENPGNVDEALWGKAKDASMKAFGSLNWKFITWFYKKQGGKFL